MALNIYWPSVCPLWRSIYSNLLPNFFNFYFIVFFPVPFILLISSSTIYPSSSSCHPWTHHTIVLVREFFLFFFYLISPSSHSLPQRCQSALNWIVRFFLILSFISSLLMLDINPLSAVSLANMFSHSVGCLFLLLMVSFAVKKLFSLMESHLFPLPEETYQKKNRGMKNVWDFTADVFL